MKKLITEVRVVKVRGGQEVRAMARSARGSKYILNSIVVLSEQKTKEEIRAGIAAATVELFEKG